MITSLEAPIVSIARMLVFALEKPAAIKRLQLEKGSNIILIRPIRDLLFGSFRSRNKAVAGLCRSVGGHRYRHAGGAIENDESLFGARNARQCFGLGSSRWYRHDVGLEIEGGGGANGSSR